MVVDGVDGAGDLDGQRVPAPLGGVVGVEVVLRVGAVAGPFLDNVLVFVADDDGEISVLLDALLADGVDGAAAAVAVGRDQTVDCLGGEFAGVLEESDPLGRCHDAIFGHQRQNRFDAGGRGRRAVAGVGRRAGRGADCRGPVAAERTPYGPGPSRWRMLVEEGDVELEVPGEATDGKQEGVFFNPEMELNRDLTVATLRAYRDRAAPAESYLDATAASGARGVRAAADGWDVTMCDVDPDAVALCESNLDRNGCEGTVRHEDANVEMHRRRYDVVDVDPFGTPVPFADAAVRSARGLLCVTATDTAPLCGAHFESGVRKYGCVPRNTEYHAEMGLRVLLSALVRTAARYDVAATPVFSHVSDHYARTYLRVEEGAQAADARIDDLGHVYHCQHCLFRTHERGLLADAPEACPECGEHLQTAGPIWLGAAHDPEFVAAVRERVPEDCGTAGRARDLCATVADELHEPTHYDQHRLTKRWNESAMAMDEFLDRLRAAGHEASRTHYGGTTFKTTADVTEIRAAVA